jgi:urease accessory protein UreH
MSGRVLRNEQWKFTELSSETKIVENQYLLYLDRFSLFPAEQNLTKEWILSNYHYLANALVYDCQLTPSLCQSFQALLCSGQSGLSGAFDLPVQSLLSGRILSLEGTRFQTIQQKFRKLLFETLLGELNTRVRK